MALTYDFTAAIDRIGQEEFDALPNGLADCIIWTMMGIDMGEITEANFDEVCFRVRLSEVLHGPLAQVGGKGVYITPEDLKPFIGLKVNVRTLTRSRWLNSRLGGKREAKDVAWNRAAENPKGRSAIATLKAMSKKK